MEQRLNRQQFYTVRGWARRVRRNPTTSPHLPPPWIRNWTRRDDSVCL